MKSIAHKTGIFVLLLLVAVPVIYAFCFHIRQFQVRQRVKEKLNEQALQTISVREDNVSWMIPGKEAWINGSLFDISSSVETNGFYTLTGFFDEEETALVMLLQRNQPQNEGSPDDFLAQLFELLQDVYKNSPGEHLLLLKQLSQKFSTPEASLCTVALPILTPPPQA